MILFFRRRIPPLDRLLLVESCSRELAERLLPSLYRHSPYIDLVTCYRGEPAGFRAESGTVFRTQDYPDAAARSRFAAELAQNRYGAIGIVCSNEPILLKWKWMLAWRVPAKLLIANENGDYFLADYAHLPLMAALARSRFGLAGGDTAATLSRALLFPFAVAFLLLYAAAVQVRRKFQTL